MPHYVYDTVSMLNPAKKWIDFDINNYSNNNDGEFLGGIFSLSPTDAARNIKNTANADFLLPPGYRSLVSTTFDYLLDLGCKTAGHLNLGERYDKGILCEKELHKILLQDPPIV